MGYVFDTHPPALTRLWGLFDAVWPGLGLALLFQTIALWLGLALLARPHGWSARGAAAVLLVGLLPPVGPWDGVVSKDALHVAAMTLGAGLLLLAERRRSLGLALASAGAMLLAGLSRHNGAVALLPLCVWLALVVREARGGPAPGARTWPVAAAGVLVALALGLLAMAGNRALATRPVYLFEAIWLHDLAGIAARTGDLRLPEHILLEPAPPSIAAVSSAYSPISAMSVMGTPLDRPLLRLSGDRERVADTGRVWRGAVLAHPGAYVAHRWEVFRHLLGLYQGPNRTDGPFVRVSSVDPRGPQGFRPGLAARAVFALCDAAVDGVLYRPWAWLLLGAGLLVVAWRRRHRAALCVGASGLLYALSYALIAPAADVRYLLWSLQAVGISAALLAAPAPPLQPGQRPPVSATL